MAWYYFFAGWLALCLVALLATVVPHFLSALRTRRVQAESADALAVTVRTFVGPLRRALRALCRERIPRSTVTLLLRNEGVEFLTGWFRPRRLFTARWGEVSDVRFRPSANRYVGASIGVLLADDTALELEFAVGWSGMSWPSEAEVRQIFRRIVDLRERATA